MFLTTHVTDPYTSLNLRSFIPRNLSLLWVSQTCRYRCRNDRSLKARHSAPQKDLHLLSFGQASMFLNFQYFHIYKVAVWKKKMVLPTSPAVANVELQFCQTGESIVALIAVSCPPANERSACYETGTLAFNYDSNEPPFLFPLPTRLYTCMTHSHISPKKQTTFGRALHWGHQTTCSLIVSDWWQSGKPQQAMDSRSRSPCSPTLKPLNPAWTSGEALEAHHAIPTCTSEENSTTQWDGDCVLHSGSDRKHSFHKPSLRRSPTHWLQLHARDSWHFLVADLQLLPSKALFQNPPMKDCRHTEVGPMSKSESNTYEMFRGRSMLWKAVKWREKIGFLIDRGVKKKQTMKKTWLTPYDAWHLACSLPQACPGKVMTVMTHKYKDIIWWSLCVALVALLSRLGLIPVSLIFEICSWQDSAFVLESG